MQGDPQRKVFSVQVILYAKQGITFFILYVQTKKKKKKLKELYLFKDNK